MIDRATLDALRFFQQNRHTMQAMQDHYRLIKSVSIPRIDPVVIQAMEHWSRLNISHLAMPDTREIRDLLRYTRELSTLHDQFASAASAASLSLPPALLEQSTREVFFHTSSIERLFSKQISVESKEPNAEEEEQKQQIIEWIAEETKSEVEQWLYQIHPALYTMWQGARQTLASHNPDRARQVRVSLRTLLDNLTRKLAPDAEIKAWSTDPQYYQDNGKPNKKGRIFYICRHIQSGDSSFAQFLEADVNAITSLWISLNQLHVPEQTISDVQLRIMVERFEAALLMFIRASGAGEE
ncbi:MAG: pPIWI-associating nuclease domain-containing protein [Ktedonobacteraceae bacterium]